MLVKITEDAVVAPWDSDESPNISLNVIIKYYDMRPYADKDVYASVAIYMRDDTTANSADTVVLKWSRQRLFYDSSANSLTNYRPESMEFNIGSGFYDQSQGAWDVVSGPLDQPETLAATSDWGFAFYIPTSATPTVTPQRTYCEVEFDVRD